MKGDYLLVFFSEAKYNDSQVTLNPKESGKVLLSLGSKGLLQRMTRIN